MRVTLRHYYDFGANRSLVGADLASPEAWDGLRTRTAGAFSLPATREEFVRGAEARLDLAARARAIHSWLEQQGSLSVASYGVGGASLEWWLHQLDPSRRLLVSDFAHATVARLADVFPEARAVHHDLRRDGPLRADVHLFHRVETELTNKEWPDVFDRFRSERILLVAAEVLGMRRVLSELLNRPEMRRREATRAGFLRSRAALEALWKTTHWSQAMLANDLHAWVLEPKTHGSSPVLEFGETAG